MSDKIFITLYHATTRESADKILSEGFKDGKNHEGATGVRFSVPALSRLTQHDRDNTEADTIIEVDVPTEIAAAADIDNNASLTPVGREMLPPTLRQSLEMDTSTEYRLLSEIVNQFRPFRSRPIEP